ncbi:stalk domain-containing protein [Paenibacillus sp. UNC451MF]|uniref:stalk domain-containing protein n=1 Tax=Paenibacillus sp. UNC451MF TaxID=1449063 RepID=UPI00048EDF3B|nr:stalk domain-containing protein [Paenibacillus sp. UNC451MF]
MKKGIITCVAAAMVTLAAIPAAVTSSPQKVFACSKGEVTSAETDYSVASNVLYGSVTNVENVFYDGKPYRMATFATFSNLKGGYVNTVLTAPDSDQCGVTFELGHTYLVYANNRLGRAAASAFDVFEGQEAENRVNELKDMAMVRYPDPGPQQITLYPGSDVTVTLDGKTIPVTPGALFYNNTLYTPMTFFRDILGYVTVWNADSNRYEILLRSEWAGIAAQGDPSQSEFKDASASIPIGTDPFEATVTYSDVQARVDGRVYPPETHPFNYGGVVYVPLRDTAEKLGLLVNWDPQTYTASIRDTRPLDRDEHPALVMKLSSNKEGVSDLIVDRIENDQALYRVDRVLQYGETPEQLKASFTDLIQENDGVSDRRIRLFLEKGDREYELVMTDELMKSLITNPLVRNSISLTLGREYYTWPDNGVIRQSNVH